MTSIISSPSPCPRGGARQPEAKSNTTNITAYHLLYANGAKAGTKPFSKDADVKVSTIADGKVVADAIKPPTMGKMEAMEAAAHARPPRRCCKAWTVKGTVKNYTDVTDAMLVHPDDGEWLMYRRNYAPAGAFRRSSRSRRRM